jgi:hypothetical protein
VKRQLINEIRDLIVERLDERSRLDELSPKKLKDIQSQIHSRDYDIRLKKISGKIDNHYKVWYQREVLKPIAQIIRSRLQNLSAEPVKVVIQDFEPKLGDLNKFTFSVFSPDGREFELPLTLTPSKDKGFLPSWVRDFEIDLKGIVIYGFRESSKRKSEIPLNGEETEVVDRILILISKLLKKPDIVEGVQALAKNFAKDISKF